MDREWTYRPPLLVGERVVWLGGSAGSGETVPCDYGPHHGTVRWIGRVPDMGPSWTVGVDFESDMTGGCDGAWKDRHIFTCQPSQGVFLPVSALIKEDNFYGKRQPTTTVTQNHSRAASLSTTSPTTLLNMEKPQATLDISLAPEPPPPKVRTPSAPSYEIHSRNYLKPLGPEVDASVYSSLAGAGIPADKRHLRSTHHQAKDKGSSSFSTSVVSSSISSSPAATTSTTVYSASVCSSAAYTTTLKVEEPNLGQMNTLNINRLLRRLEAAISCGKHAEAANLAHELAELRVSCSVTRNPKDKVSTDKKPSGASAISVDGHLTMPATEGNPPRTYTPSSNVSECFYDAYEKLENEEFDDQLKKAAMNVSSENSQPQQDYLKNSQRAEDQFLEANISSDAIGPVSPIQAPASIYSTSGHNTTAPSAKEDHLEAYGQQAVSDDSNSVTNLRENRVDPSRREVKSDTISKFLDGLKDIKKDITDANVPFNVKMYVEDKNSHQGPIKFAVVASMTVGGLREKVYQDFGFPPEFQRWILGRRLADDDSHTLGQHKVAADGCPIFLYLVAPEAELQSPNKPQLNEAAYSRYSINQSSSQSSLASSGRDQVYGAEGINPKFYNPDTHKYEISVECDYSDMNGDDDEYEDDESVSDNEDTLKENNVHMYQNIGDANEKIQENGFDLYRSVQNGNLSEATPSNSSHLGQDSAVIQKMPDSVYQVDHLDVNIQNGNKAFSNPDTSYDAVDKPSIKEDQTYAKPEQQINKPAIPTYTNVEEHSLQQHEPIYQPEKPMEQILHQQEDQSQQNENDSDEARYVYKQQATTELQTQKILIRELQHQQHYVQVPLVNQVAPESHSGQSMTHQDTKSIPQSSSSVPQNESYYDLQPQVKQVSMTKQDQPELQQQSKVLQNNISNELKQSGQEKPAQVPTPSRSSSLKLQQRVAQVNQAQLSPSNSQMKSPKNQQYSRSQTAMPSLANSDQPAQNVQFENTLQESQSQKLNVKENFDRQQNAQKAKETLAKQKGNEIAPPDAKSQPQTLPSITSQPQVAKEQPTQSQETTSAPSKLQGWVCPSCTLVNKWERPGCEVCAMERPSTGHLGGASENTKTASGIGAAMSALDRQGCVPNLEVFECRVCFLDIAVGDGVMLRDCLHMFCRDCLSNSIKFSDTAEVKCPYRDDQYSCDSSLQDREIKELLNPKEYEKHLNKSVKQAEGSMQNVFHCKTPDCPGFCQFEDNVNTFHCDVCKCTNCLTCQAHHEEKTCQEYQDDLTQKVDEAAMKTKKFFDDMIRRGDGLPCPKCSVMLVRKWGCDWMRCPMCRTEICWVTRGPRWGPGGTGDVSGGCKCGIRGRKCHPKCTYCH